MALIFYTSRPRDLYEAFVRRVHQTEIKGKITTWEQTGNDEFTHKDPRWHRLAWFVPTIDTNPLRSRFIMNIHRPNNKSVSVPVYS